MLFSKDKHTLGVNSTKITSFLGYIKEVDDSGCCPVVNLVCKPELCPPPADCPQYYSLKSEKIEGKCCPLNSCEPPKDKCIFETEYTEAEKGGQRRLTKLEKQKLLKGADETWKDGPCRECKCSLTSIGKLLLMNVSIRSFIQRKYLHHLKYNNTLHPILFRGKQ